MQSPDPVTRSLVLALGVCYHARLQDRRDFERRVAAEFSPPLTLPGGEQQFRDEIRLYVSQPNYLLYSGKFFVEENFCELPPSEILQSFHKLLKAH